MKLILAAPEGNVEIAELAPGGGVQIVPTRSAGFAHWTWQVTPKKQGKLHLELLCYAVKGNSDPEYIETYQAEVVVDANGPPTAIVISAWDKVAGAIADKFAAGLVTITGAGLLLVWRKLASSKARTSLIVRP